MSDPVSPDAAPNAPAPTDDAATAEAATRRRLAWGYGGGGLLVVAAVVLAWWALANGSAGSAGSAASSASPSSSAVSAEPVHTAAGETSSPSAAAPQPGATSSPSAPPVDAAAPVAEDAPQPPRIDAFETVEASAACEDDRAATASLTFRWRTSDAQEIWIGEGTTDASAQPFAAVPASSEGYTDLAFACSNPEQLYTLTARGPGGTVSTSVTVVRALS